MFNSVDLGDILMSLQDLLFMVYYEKIPDLGYLYISTTFMMFYFELKNAYKFRSMKAEMKRLKLELGKLNAKEEEISIN
jgi:hypothetical protein